MFSIYNKSKNMLLAIVNNITYIKYFPENKFCAIVYEKEIANGIIFDRKRYNITDEMIIPNADFAEIKNILDDDIIYNPAELYKNSLDIDTMEKIILKQDNIISSLEEALMDLDNSIAEKEETNNG